MDIGPLLPGRIPNSLVADRLRFYLVDSRSRLNRLQDQLSTGQKFFLPSEDPSNAARTISLQSLVERKTQVQTNIKADKSFLSSSESALASAGDLLNRAKAIVLEGVGSTSSATQKAGLATETDSLLRSLVNLGNSEFRGRSLFGGSQAKGEPFRLNSDNTVTYLGDTKAIQSYFDVTKTGANNVDGNSAFGVLSTPLGRPVSPALTLQTGLHQLYGGSGVSLGQIDVTVNTGSPVTKSIDLTGAHTIGDIKAVIESAFPPGDITVSINSTNDGIQLTPASGTVAVADLPGASIARNLGIRSAAVANISGGPLSPSIVPTTTLASLNGGTGIGSTSGTGLRIVNGNKTSIVDLSSAVTVEDVATLVRQADPDAIVSINEAGDGLAVSTRISGVNFSVGENGGQNATRLGIRSTIGSTLLSSLNYGQGVPISATAPLQITRRDGTAANVDLTGATTVQDVITKINAVDPGNLNATLNSVGNGISITDNSGTGPLSIASNATSTALGLAGSETGSVNTVPLVGSDTNLREAPGSFHVLSKLADALRKGDDAALLRISGQIDTELARLTSRRGELGGQLKTLETAENRVKDEQLSLQQSLSDSFSVDFAEVISELSQKQAVYEAVLKTSASTLQLSLVNYL